VKRDGDALGIILKGLKIVSSLSNAYELCGVSGLHGSTAVQINQKLISSDHLVEESALTLPINKSQPISRKVEISQLIHLRDIREVRDGEMFARWVGLLANLRLIPQRNKLRYNPRILSVRRSGLSAIKSNEHKCQVSATDPRKTRTKGKKERYTYREIPPLSTNLEQP
jgi:hypothetical protein